MSILRRIKARGECQFILLLSKAAPFLAFLWWLFLLARGLLPALFVVAMGLLIGAINEQGNIVYPLVLVGVFFVLVQILSPIHLMVSQNLGSRMAAFLYDRLMVATTEPDGIGHLEDPELHRDLAMARDFDLGISSPPLNISMDFISAGLVEMVAGLTAAAILFAYTWWAAPLLAFAWLATHWLMRESGVWKDRQTDAVRAAQQHADYAYQMAVAPPAAKEIRLFGLSNWVVDRFKRNRRFLHDLRWEATRLREKPLIWSLLVVLSANVFLFSMMVSDVIAGVLGLQNLVIFAGSAMTTSMIAFGGLSWALDGAAAPAGAVMRLHETMRARGQVSEPEIQRADVPTGDICFENLTFAYPTTNEVVLKDLSLVVRKGTSLAIVGQNGAGKTTIAKLLCRFYDPNEGQITIAEQPIESFAINSWRQKTTAVFQDYMKLELSLRENVCPDGSADDETIWRALEHAGASSFESLDTILNKAYTGGTDLSGGQWQRIALARALCAVYQGAEVVLLDEPTAQLDVRGEQEIFDRLLAETAKVTTILISHRFSTVRKADRICVLEGGNIIEIGPHDELMALNGRYREMFDLQASRFEEEEGLDVLN